MATVSVVKIKVRRGTDVQRKQVTLDVGEIGYVTDPDSHRLFVGDGVTPGGTSVAMKFYTGSLSAAAAGTSIALAKAQVGDLIYDTDSTHLFVLTGVNLIDGFPGYDDPISYQFIGFTPDKITLNFNSYGKLAVTTQGISAVNLSTDVLDTHTGGFWRPSPTAPFKIANDNNSIKINTLNHLYVDPYNTDWASNRALHTTRPIIPGLLWIDTTADNALKIS